MNYLEYCQFRPKITNYFQRTIKPDLLAIGNEILYIFYYVHDPENNPATKSQEEETTIVWFFINCAQWVSSGIGSYQMLSLAGVAAALRGIYECLISLKFIITRAKEERDKYLKRYIAYEYAEKYKFRRKTTSENIRANQQIETDYISHAKEMFEYETTDRITGDIRKEIRKDWTGEGWNIKDLTLKAGWTEEQYETYYTWTSQFIHNTTLIRNNYTQKLPLPDPGHGIQSLERLLHNNYMLAIEILYDYSSHFGKQLPEETIKKIVSNMGIGNPEG